MFALSVAFASQPALAQSPQANAMTLAQANDRCMTTFAVRMTKTDATDDAIFSSAIEGCKDLKAQLDAAIANEYPAAQADELKSQLDAQAKPNFLNLLQKIRSDRAKRGGN
jgi:ABC-type cobalamin/Fe3+-siderophores transport system ATPase subunit